MASIAQGALELTTDGVIKANPGTDDFSVLTKELK